MTSYDTARELYKPRHIKVLMIAESQPPEAATESSRQFYRSDHAYKEDRLFINTIRALYPETMEISQQVLQEQKDFWLKKFQADGWYMIEALEISLPHEVTKQERQERIRKALPRLIDRVQQLVDKDTKIILIKSNVFIVAAGPLRNAGYNVLNTDLLDYPGRFNQKAYREKLAHYAQQIA